MTNSTIQECREQIAAELEPLLVGSGLPVNQVYSYRTLPNLVSRAVQVSYLGGMPSMKLTSGTHGRYRDFAIILLAQHDNTAATLQAAEDDLDEIEDIITDWMESSKNIYWKKITMPRPTTRPPSPRELPKTRFGEIYIRTHLF